MTRPKYVTRTAVLVITDAADGEDEEEILDDDLFCVICNKPFKTEKA